MMKETTISGTVLEVSDGGERITLLDGSVWEVGPTDLPEACLWLPTLDVEITGSEMRRRDDGTTITVTRCQAPREPHAPPVRV